jgi:hypothetical protein
LATLSRRVALPIWSLDEAYWRKARGELGLL